MNASPERRVGVCSWSLQAKDPAQLVDRLRACGVDLIQLALNPVANDPGTWGGIGDALQGAGIRVASGMFGCKGEDYSTLETIRRTGGIVPDEHWEANQKIIAGAVAAAKRLGIDTLSTHIGFIPHDEADPSFDRLLDRARRVADTLGGAGMTLLFETGQETADDLWQFLDRLERDNVGVNFDPANMILYDKGDPVEALRRLMPRVRQIHIKDATRTQTPGTWGAETPAGDGDVDFPALFGVLDEAGYRGDLIIEREGGDQRIEDVRTAVERINEWASGGAASARGQA